MIRLTLNFRSQIQERTFYQSVLLIGSGFEKAVDIALEEQALHDEHVKIVKEAEGFFVYNLEQDPFTLLNGQSFNRSILQEGDSIKIGDAELLIEELSEEEAEPDIKMSDEEMQDLLSDIEQDLQEDEAEETSAEELAKDLQGPEDLLDSNLDEPAELDEPEDLTESEDLPQELAKEETEEKAQEAELDLAVEEQAFGDVAEDASESKEEPEAQEPAPAEEEAQLEEEEPAAEDAKEEELSSEEAEAMLDSLEEGIEESSSNEEIPNAFLEGDEEIVVDENIPVLDEDFDLDSVLGELFPEREEEEEALDIESIIEESEKIEEEEGRKKAELLALETKLIFDEDDADLLYIREHAEEQALDDLGIKKEGEVPAEEEEEEGEQLELSQDLLDAEVEIQEEIVFEEDEEEDEELDEIEMLLGVKDAPKLFAKLIKSTAMLFFCLCVSFYFFQLWVLGQNNQKELQVARSLSDLSMALLHKQVYSPKSPHPIDSEAFLEQHLRAVVDKSFEDKLPLLESQFLQTLDYQLKVFFDQSKKEFILLAIPNDGSLQGFFPKGCLIFDSKSFQLLRSPFSKPWKEVFAKVSFLDEVQEYEIEDLRLKSTSLSFALLNAGDPAQGFAVPRELEELAPYGFERVYNLPRYHRFAKQLVDLALQAYSEEGSLDDLARLKQSYERFIEFKELALYASTGKEEAQKIFWSFQQYIPEHAFLYAYLLEQKLERANLLDPQVLATYFTSLDKAPIEDFDLETKREKEKEIEKLEHIKEKALFEEPLRALLAKQELQRQNIAQEMENLSAEGMSEKAFAKRYLELFYAHQDLKETQSLAIQEAVQEIFEGQVLSDPQKYGQAFMDVLEELQILPLLSKDFQETLIEEQLAFQSIERELSIESDFKHIEEVEDLKNLDLLVNRLSRKIHSENFDNIKRQLAYQNQLRQVVLAKLGKWLFDPEKAPKNRQLLDRVLENSDISEDDQRRFYLQEFDVLMERMRSFPDQRELARLKDIRQQLAEFSEYDELLSEKEKKLIRKQQEGSIQEIEEQKESLEVMQAKISKIPVIGILAQEPELQRKSLAKKGQQMLLEASRKEPSQARDKVLEKVIGLLHQNLIDNRALWGDILECRRLIAQTAEKQLLEVLNGDVGFVQGDRPLSNMIKSSLTQYFNEKKKLAALRDRQQFIAQYELFRIQQKNNLQTALRYLNELQNSSKKLKNGIVEYEKRLQVFANDYEKAKLEGFFVKNFQLQSLMAARLNRKIYHAASLRKTVDELNSTILSASQEHAKIAQNELAFLEDIQTFSPQELSIQSQAVHEVVYPNLAAEDIEEKVQDIFNIVIAPLE